tara:strand:- start:459 stop:656 length:198 start_codon:yes stop_codon:yes gene_type:complete
MISNGVSFEIDWPNFKVGSSIFIPAVDTADALRAVKKESQRLEFEFAHKVVIEDGIKGLRVWRLG